MSILIFEDSSSSTFGGGQQVTFNAAKFLQNHDDLILIDFTNKSKFFNQSKSFFQSYLLLHDFNNTKIKINVLNIFLIPYNLFILLMYFIKKKNNIKFIYVTAKKPLFYSFLINAIFGIKYIYHVHNIYNSKQLIFKYIIKNFIKKSLINICVSNSVSNSLSTILNKTIIYNPVETPFNINKDTNFNNRKINLGFIGSLIKCKNANEFLKLSDYLPENKYNFLIYGNGPELSKLKSNYIKSNIFFKNFILNKEVIYNSIDILIVPSRCNESFSLVVFEAFNYNIPVIAYNQGAHKEFLINNFDSILYQNNISEIIYAIEKLVFNLEFRNYIIKNSKIKIDRFKYSNFCNSFNLVLKENELI